MDMPYSQAYDKLVKLSEKVEKEAIENPDATLAGFFSPPLGKLYSLWIKDRTYANALHTAIAIYMLKARTGKLPDALPAGLPKDIFSGEDFHYEKTAAGFVLRCHGKNLSDTKTPNPYEYEFKVKK